MIDKLTVDGFKRFDRQTIQLAPLTIFAGLNGAGKSSAIQSILLAHDAFSLSRGDAVRLNGPFGLELGTANDVRNWKSDDAITIEINDTHNISYRCRLTVPFENALYLNLEESSSGCPSALSRSPRALTYLSAERLGPRSISETAAHPAAELEVGSSGQYSAQILAILGGRPLDDPERLHPSREPGNASLLKIETEKWLSEIVRPIEFNAMQLSPLLASLQFRIPDGDWVAAPNMGFGVSYALPIILSGLIAKRGGLVIVENPEAHLHPRGQSIMGTFLAWLAGKGVQVIVETHSDHVLNGIRRAVGQYKYLEHTDALISYFSENAGSTIEIHTLTFSEVGSISHWPQGFFDQYQVDVASLGQVRRGKL